MEATLLRTADILDIIFDGRNKDYGAYELRRGYNKRLKISMIVMGSLVLLLVIGYLVSGHGTYKKKIETIVEVPLENDPHKEPEQATPPQPKKPQVVQTAAFTPPRITREEEIKPEEKPPEVETLENTKIGDANQNGIQDDNITAPPTDHNGVVEAPKDNTDYDMTFRKVEIESEYPGGPAAWARYLNRTFIYPEEAQEKEIEGTVVVKFIVDKEGKVSDVEVVSGPNELREEAMRVIRKSGDWTPAIQNGRKVKSYKSQSIMFKLEP